MRLLPFALLVLLGCASPPEPVILEPGTEVPLILLQELSAGASKVGTEVALMVTEDITSPDGRILIPRGAIAYGRVNWSRSAGALSKVVNEPPRLAVTVDRTVSIDNKTVMLQASQSGDPFQFTGKNSGAKNATEGLTKALEDDATRAKLETLFGAFEGKPMGDQRVVRELATELNLKNIETMARGHSIREIEGVMRSIAEGEATRIVGGQTTLLIDTIAELAGLRIDVGDRISGIFRGNTIHAYPGTPVTAYVAQPLAIDAK